MRAAARRESCPGAARASGRRSARRPRGPVCGHGGTEVGAVAAEHLAPLLVGVVEVLRDRWATLSTRPRVIPTYADAAGCARRTAGDRCRRSRLVRRRRWWRRPARRAHGRRRAGTVWTSVDRRPRSPRDPSAPMLVTVHVARLVTPRSAVVEPGRDPVADAEPLPGRGDDRPAVVEVAGCDQPVAHGAVQRRASAHGYRRSPAARRSRWSCPVRTASAASPARAWVRSASEA